MSGKLVGKVLWLLVLAIVVVDGFLGYTIFRPEKKGKPKPKPKNFAAVQYLEKLSRQPIKIKVRPRGYNDLYDLRKSNIFPIPEPPVVTPIPKEPPPAKVLNKARISYIGPISEPGKNFAILEVPDGMAKRQIAVREGDTFSIVINMQKVNPKLIEVSESKVVIEHKGETRVVYVSKAPAAGTFTPTKTGPSGSARRSRFSRSSLILAPVADPDAGPGMKRLKVRSVSRRSGLRKRGLRAGDVIIRVNGVEVPPSERFDRPYIQNLTEQMEQEGSKIDFIRGGQQKSL